MFARPKNTNASCVPGLLNTYDGYARYMDFKCEHFGLFPFHCVIKFHIPVLIYVYQQYPNVLSLAQY